MILLTCFIKSFTAAPTSTFPLNVLTALRTGPFVHKSLPPIELRHLQSMAIATTEVRILFKVSWHP